MELAAQRNATYGLPMTREDKRDFARKIYHQTPERNRDKKKVQLAELLSVPERTIRGWLSRIDKDAKVSRDKRVLDMWLACYTNVDIAEVENIDEKTVRDVIGEMADLPKVRKLASEHLTDFEPPLYNIYQAVLSVQANILMTYLFIE